MATAASISSPIVSVMPRRRQRCVLGLLSLHACDADNQSLRTCMSGAGQRVYICSTSISSTCASHRPAHTTWLAGDATNGRDLGQTHPRQGKAPASPTAVALRVNCCGSVTSHTDQCWLVHQVPLGARYHEVIPEDRRFTPQMLVTKLRSEGKEVGCF